MARDVLLLVLDSVRPDRIGPYNDAIDHTEHLDRFAERDTVTTFSTAISQAPWSLPAHASLFTGQYPWEHGATQETLYADTEGDQLPELFSDQGYHTVSVTDNPWITRSTGLADGFDAVENFFPAWFDVLERNGLFELDRLFGTRMEPFIDFWLNVGHALFGRGYESLTDWKQIFGSADLRQVEKVLETAHGHMDSERPWFAFVNMMEVHTPRDPPQEYWERHGDVPLEEVPEVPPYLTPSGVDGQRLDRIQQLYDASVDCLDDLVGELLDRLEAEDRLDDTVVVITADHGELLGEDGKTGHSFSVHEKLVSVPLLVHHPDGDVEDRPVELRQLYDLIPYWAGIAEEPELDTRFQRGGYGFPDLDYKSLPDSIRAEYDVRFRFVRDGERKLIERTDRDGAVEHRMLELEDREEIPVDDRFRDLLPDA